MYLCRSCPSQRLHVHSPPSDAAGSSVLTQLHVVMYVSVLQRSITTTACTWPTIWCCWVTSSTLRDLWPRRWPLLTWCRSCVGRAHSASCTSSQCRRRSWFSLSTPLTVTSCLLCCHSDPNSPVDPVNSWIFVAVLYFPVFCLYFYLLPFSVAFICLLLKYNLYSPLKDINIKRYWHQLVSVDCS